MPTFSFCPPKIWTLKVLTNSKGLTKGAGSRVGVVQSSFDLKRGSDIHYHETKAR